MSRRWQGDDEGNREHTLDDYAAVAHLAAAAGELKTEAACLVPLRDLRVSTEWVVIGSGDPAFFALTKRLHNLIYGSGDPRLGPADREVLERVGRENAARLQPLLRPGDVLIVHGAAVEPRAAEG